MWPISYKREDPPKKLGLCRLKILTTVVAFQNLRKKEFSRGIIIGKLFFRNFRGMHIWREKNSGISGEKNFSVRCKNIRLNLNNLNNFTQI